MKLIDYLRRLFGKLRRFEPQIVSAERPIAFYRLHARDRRLVEINFQSPCGWGCLRIRVEDAQALYRTLDAALSLHWLCEGLPREPQQP